MHIPRIRKAHSEWGLLVSSVRKLLEKVRRLERHCNSGPIKLWHFWHLLICTKPGQIVSDYHPPFSNGFSVFNYYLFRIIFRCKTEAPFINGVVLGYIISRRLEYIEVLVQSNLALLTLTYFQFQGDKSVGSDYRH